MYPAVEETKAHQRTEFVGPGIDAFEDAATGFIGDMVRFRRWTSGKWRAFEPQFVAHVKSTDTSHQPAPERTINFALVQHELVALMSAGIERNSRGRRKAGETD